RFRSPCAAGSKLLGKGALRSELDLELSREELALELGVLADIGRDHLPDLPPFEEQPESEVVDAAVVRDDGEILDAHLVDLRDQVLGDAAQTEPARDDRHAVAKSLQRLLVAVDSLVEARHSCSPEDRMHDQACRPRFRLLSLNFLSINLLRKSIDDAPSAAGLRRRRANAELCARVRAIAHVAAGAQPRDQKPRGRARREAAGSNRSEEHT